MLRFPWMLPGGEFRGCRAPLRCRVIGDACPACPACPERTRGESSRGALEGSTRGEACRGKPDPKGIPEGGRRARPSATTIIPELQDLQEGDEILLDRRTAVRVTHLDPPRAMVWALLGAKVELGLIASGSMAYGLERLEGDRTRLMSRVRGHVRGGLALPYVYLFDEWVNFVMQRRQLLGIKARAEA